MEKKFVGIKVEKKVEVNVDKVSGKPAQMLPVTIFEMSWADFQSFLCKIEHEKCTETAIHTIEGFECFIRPLDTHEMLYLKFKGNCKTVLTFFVKIDDKTGAEKRDRDGVQKFVPNDGTYTTTIEFISIFEDVVFNLNDLGKIEHFVKEKATLFFLYLSPWQSNTQLEYSIQGGGNYTLLINKL